MKNSLHFLLVEVFKKRGRNLWGLSESSNFASTKCICILYYYRVFCSLNTGFLNTHDNHIFGWITCPLFLMEQFFNIIFLLTICKFQTLHCDHTGFPLLPGSPSHPSALLQCPLQKKKKKENKRKNPPSLICVAHMLIQAWSNSQWLIL